MWAKMLSQILLMSVKIGATQHLWKAICQYTSKALSKCVCLREHSNVDTYPEETIRSINKG